MKLALKPTLFERLHEAWPRLSPWQRKALLFTAFFSIIRVRLRSLRPIDLLLPVMLAQISIFVYFALLPSSQALLNAVIGNVVIAGLAMLPVTFQKVHLINS